jgi:ABC-type thiamine transport system substrate-binding protein
MKHAGIMIVVGIMAMSLAFNAGAAEKVTVYTSLETDETVKYIEAARRDMPDLEINIIRFSTGELGARMLAEKDNPQADLVWGWAVTTTRSAERSVCGRSRDLARPASPESAASSAIMALNR